VSAGLLLSCCAAFSATCYAILSCQFVTVTFWSDQGSFENHFATNAVAASQVLRPFRANLGLFQWLSPFDVNAAWSDGTCVGYQESMLAVLQDGTFDAARSLGVIAVLMGGICSLWALMSSCIAWNWVQLLMLRCLLCVGTVACGLCFLMLRADVCHDALPDGSCELAEGGMVLIAGMILWVAAFMIAVVFLRPYEAEEYLEDMDEVTKARQAGNVAARRAMALQAKNGTPDTKGSFDSSDSVNSYQNRQRGVRYLQQEDKQQPKAHSVVRSRSPVPQQQTRDRVNPVGVAPTRLYDSDTGHRTTKQQVTAPSTKTRLYDSDTGHLVMLPPSSRGRGLVATRMAQAQARPPAPGRRAVASPPVQIAPRHGGGSRSVASRASTLTIDDVSQRNELEVYIGQKMQRINVLMSDSSAEV
jgi:hypothetical protein